MRHNGIRKWVAPEFSDYVDRLHAKLIKEGVDVSKEDITRIIQVMQENNGRHKQTIIIIKERENRRDRGIRHKIEDEPYGILEIPELRLNESRKI
ncbi:MAG: hypothetical protein NT130_05860 [Candidatus Micrarchaeota archaeon]|nr:hypothetical protein [Candidatus Micrarchaeota archaeon]